MNYGSVIKSFYHLSCLATPAVTFILKLEQSQTTQEYLQVTLLFISLVLLNSVMQFLYRHFLQFFTKTRVYEAIPQHTAVTWNRPQMISFFHSVTNKSLFSFVPTACLQMTSSGHAWTLYSKCVTLITACRSAEKRVNLCVRVCVCVCFWDLCIYVICTRVCVCVCLPTWVSPLFFESIQMCLPRLGPTSGGELKPAGDVCS